MLIEFAVSNYRSIRDRQAISFVATPAKEHEASHVCDSGAPGVDRLLRSAVIYGANAAGKSNLLKAMDTMQDMVMLKNQLDDPLPVVPYLLDSNSEKPTTFEVAFVEEGVKYQYGFECTRTEVIEEWLFAFPEKRAQKWFHRSRNEDGETVWEFGSSLKGGKKAWSEATRKNALFLSTAIQLNAQQLQPVFSWFRNRLRVVVGSGLIADTYSKEMLESSSERIVALLKNADSGIYGLETFSKEPAPVFKEIAEKALPDDVRARIFADVGKGVRTKHVGNDGREVWFDMDDESEGTRKLFACAGPLIDVLTNGRILVIDELNNSLHPIMVRWIVNLFNSESNLRSAQLLFATHATSVLSLDIFRRDQIWFAEKAEGATSIYPLTDFSPRKEASLSKGYLQGRYGAVPFLSAGGIL